MKRMGVDKHKDLFLAGWFQKLRNAPLKDQVVIGERTPYTIAAARPTQHRATSCWSIQLPRGSGQREGRC